MYVGIDVGGTKTFVAIINSQGVIKKKVKFLTNKDYEKFLDDVKNSINELGEKKFAAGAIGVPGRIDREHGRAIKFGNLPWTNVSIQKDIEHITHCPIVIENDAKLAALSEANLLKDKYSKVLYITIGTGIGVALISGGKIDTNVGDGGGRSILLEHNGKTMPWEDFASGRAIFNKYGEKAKDIEDESIWRSISRDLSKGFIELIAITEPGAIVIGGGVGNSFQKFSHFLKQDIEKYSIPLVKLPVILKAERPDDAVIYGCYDIARQHYPHATANS